MAETRADFSRRVEDESHARELIFLTLTGEVERSLDLRNNV